MSLAQWQLPGAQPGVDVVAELRTSVCPRRRNACRGGHRRGRRVRRVGIRLPSCEVHARVRTRGALPPRREVARIRRGRSSDGALRHPGAHVHDARRDGRMRKQESGRGEDGGVGSTVGSVGERRRWPAAARERPRVPRHPSRPPGKAKESTRSPQGRQDVAYSAAGYRPFKGLDPDPERDAVYTPVALNAVVIAAMGGQLVSDDPQWPVGLPKPYSRADPHDRWRGCDPRRAGALLLRPSGRRPRSRVPGQESARSAQAAYWRTSSDRLNAVVAVQEADRRDVVRDDVPRRASAGAVGEQPQRLCRQSRGHGVVRNGGSAVRAVAGVTEDPDRCARHLAEAKPNPG